MNEIKVIEQQEILGKSFAIYGDLENPLFLAKDVAEWIEHKQADVLVKQVDDDEKLTLTLFSSGQNRDMWFLTESGLFEVLMQSRKPIAKAFKKEVKSMLKSIRKNGAYMTPKTIEETLQDPDFIISLATKLKQEQEEKLQLARANEVLVLEVQAKQQALEEVKPKTAYYDLVLNSKDLISITMIAKDYGFSGMKLNKFLANQKVQYQNRDKSNKVWLLYQKYADKGYTGTKTADYLGSDGEIHTNQHTYWTQKGRLFIYELLKEHGHLPLLEREQQMKIV